MDILRSLLADAGLQEALLGLFGIILTIIINRAASAFTAATGIAIERDAREALHSAIKSGVEAALARGTDAGFEEVKAFAIHHAQHSIPEKIEQLVPGDGVLDRLVLRYYREAMAHAGLQIPADPTPSRARR
ncbi:hypothetical protein [Salipiger bermudensis]|uniref:hypothetical protein n=1 Tax=Salipiger bermudensis TaxID=344736 RepID=UPI001CD6AE8C|nr:hypothetical protein [Salipiger bermudensis]MCA0963210.1 hypothetical protein [Salipiger bermudensis]